MTTDLPPTFFLYIRSRHSSYDAFSGFILCDATSTPENGHAVWKITPRPAIFSQSWTVSCFSFTQLNTSYRGQCTVRSADGLLLSKKIYTTTHHANTPLTAGPASLSYPVLEIAKHTTIFGKQHLKRNVPLQWLQTTDPMPSAIAAAIAVTPSGNVIQHVAPAPAPKKLNKVARPAPGGGTLPLFVAKQLLELSQMKHEMCPITAEEFISGETAAMPCGHLFMRMAIEETFKKEPGKCPACRQLGAPTYC